PHAPRAAAHTRPRVRPWALLFPVLPSPPAAARGAGRLDKVYNLHEHQVSNWESAIMTSRGLVLVYVDSQGGLLGYALGYAVVAALAYLVVSPTVTAALALACWSATRRR